MAVKKKVVDIETGNAEKSVKSLRNELKELKDQLVNLEQGTQEYNLTLQLAANIQHDLKEMNEELAASAMDFGLIMGNTTATINGAISGFQALTASMSLLGIENEGTLETIKKLQSLMALTQGIAGIENGIKAFKRLTSAITNSTAITNLFSKALKTAATTEQVTSAATKGLQGAMVGETAATGAATVATHAFKKALISTGIGAIVVAIGALIANLDKLGKLFSSSAKDAEKQAAALKKYTEAANEASTATRLWNGFIEDSEYQHNQEIKTMDDTIKRMEAEGKTEAEIAAQREKNNKRLEDIVADEVARLKAAEGSIASYFKEAYNYEISMKNVFIEKAKLTDDLIEKETILKQLEAGEKVAGYKKDDIENLKTQIELRKENIDKMLQYIDYNKKETEWQDKLTTAENEAIKARTNARKKATEQAKKDNTERIKLLEDLRKFDALLTIDIKKDKEKELATIKKAEDDKIAELKKYKEKGLLSETQYRERLNKITLIYNLQRNEVEYKYAEEAFKKREDILNKQFELEQSEAERRKVQNEMLINKEHLDNLIALNKREISIVDYYNKEKEIISKNYDTQSKLLEEDFKRLSALISELINERYELLKQNGISDEQRNLLLADINQMSDLLLTLEVQHNAALQDLAAETTSTIAELNQSVIEELMESLRILTEGIVSSMDTITSIGDGLSSQWATAFDTMSNGLINLGQKIKEGGAQWQDYGQLAVAAFSAAGSVMSALADQLETETKEGFEQLKKYQIAAVTMNMLGGVISAWTSAMNPANAWMTIWGLIAMGAASTAMILATGIMQIQKIKQQQFNGGGSASGSPSNSAMSSVVSPVQYTQDVQGAEIEGAIKDSKVYVTESDITDTQKRVDVAESEAKY